jgi:uncharacterized protein YecE (DUF72 family)
VSLFVGSSGWSYPSWKPGFYPPGSRSEDFLGLYAERLPAVELNSTGYRLPSAEQFGRWVEQVPDEFRFAVKAPALALRRADVVAERLRELGDRLGCVRVVLDGARDDSTLERLVSAFHGARLALDVRDESWTDAVAATEAVRVDDWDGGDQGWCYVRFRDPPYDAAALKEIGARLQGLLDAGVDVFAFFRHEDEPTAPRSALELLDLVRG